MEIYRNRETELRLPAPIADATYSVMVTSPGGQTFHENISPTPLKELIIPIEFQHTLYDGEVELSINIETADNFYTVKEFVNVVTPLFTSNDLGGEYPADKVPELERLVRHVVEAKTGQSFGKRFDAFPSYGTGHVRFSAPMIEFTGVSDRYATNSITLSPPKLAYEVMEDRFGMFLDWEGYHIKTDSTLLLTRRNRGCVFVKGIFGYEYVPRDVKEAALLLAGMWGCEQAVWRDRYIQTMRSSDWSVSYHRNGFLSTTGSVTADLLLAKYSRKYVPEVF